VRIDSTGLRIRTRTYGRAWDFNSVLTAFYQGTLTIEVLPDACVVVPYGRICDLDPPSLAAAPTFAGGLELRLASAPASTIGKYVFGTRPLELRLPGGLCWLNTDVLLTLPVVTDALGEARLELPLPRDPRLSFQVQSVLLAKTATGLPLLATNALRVVCR
jgi:hypothetical protein